MKRLLITLALLALLIIPGYAAETVILTDSYSDTPYWGIGASVIGGDNRRVYIDFSSVATPNEYVFYSQGSVSPGPAPDQYGTFEMSLGTNTIATGTYQFDNGTFSSPYTEMILLHFDSWNPYTYSGCQYVNITTNPTITGEITGYQQGPSNPTYQNCGSRRMTWDHSTAGQWYNAAGTHYYSYSSTSTDTITATNLTPVKNAMILRTDVSKSGSASLTRIYTNNTLAYAGSAGSTSETTVTIGADVMYSMYVPATGHFVNSSIIFPWYLTEAGTTPTPTPTPTPTTTTTSGYVNTYFQCVDGNDNSRISGCNLALKDNFAGTWSNSTADDDGTHFISTHVNSNVSGYATATGYLSTERTNLATFAEGLYELIMWPSDTYCATPGSCGTAYDPGTGNINLLVIVSDHDTGDSLSNAEIKLVESAGATTYGSTNEAGVATFIVSNQTQFRIVASKSLYTSTSKLHTTSAFGPDTVRLELSKSYVTASPTVTVTDASGNVVETLDMRPSSEKDAAMMEKLRDAGPGLIDLCILAITVYILMSILGAFGFKL